MSDLNSTFPKKPLLISLGIHLLLVLAMIIKPFFSSELEPFEQAIRIDVIAMPDKGQKIEDPVEVPKPKKEKVKEVVAKPKEKKTVAKTPEKKIVKEVAIVKDEDSGLSEEDALKKLQELTKNRPQPKKAEEPQQEVKGNRVSRGTDLVGVEKLEYGNYRGILHSYVSKNWDLPKWLLEGNLSARAVIKIDGTGNIISTNLVKRSGNTIFDQHVLDAISSSSPVAAPPDKFKDIVFYEGVLLSFPR